MCLFQEKSRIDDHPLRSAESSPEIVQRDGQNDEGLELPAVLRRRVGHDVAHVVRRGVVLPIVCAIVCEVAVCVLSYGGLW